MATSTLLRYMRTPPTEDAYKANTSSLPNRLATTLARTWDLGFTAFGGPPAHFQILHTRFVDGRSARHPAVTKYAPWLDEQTYQELFAICQALPGPGSTKMAFCIALLHAGFLPALAVFTLWAGPGALGMFALALGIKRVDETLPTVVYALLSGLNSATVGVIALAAVQLAEKAITDPLSRVLVIAGACAGLCYNSLWYFPLLMVIAGIVTVAWDCWARGYIGRWRQQRKAKKENRPASARRASDDGVELQPVARADGESATKEDAVSLPEQPAPAHPAGMSHRRPVVANSSSEDLHVQADIERQEAPAATLAREENNAASGDNEEQDKAQTWDRRGGTDMLAHAIPIKLGISIIVAFFISFIAILTTRAVLDSPPLELDLFANMYLAGTIIFGGGPVVIPLLRSYVVDPGWVSPRDFLIGLALIQAFPGPNFNFAVFLGALALSSSTYANATTSSFIGALLGFIGIFTPGLVLAVGVQSIWRVLRQLPWVVALLRGVNAGAVGLVFTAVYRLWEIGWLTVDESRGRSLGGDPWWVVVAAVAFSSGKWFGVPPAGAIVAGGLAGVAWWGVVGN